MSQITGKREWAVLFTRSMTVCSESPTSTTSISGRGTITSRTRISDAASAPSMMPKASASSSLR
ncbi:MAG: hypothetical protein AW07_02209 [Candidatus Accumulibacter sp. SK-11]|nr:MAG: hypothetical protein AW07_02209 [Candidatus Accumulibacter sp. SK-11]